MLFNKLINSSANIVIKNKYITHLLTKNFLSFKIISIFASKSKIKKMKKVFITLALVATIFMSSCMGSFNLTKKYYSFNKSLGDKWLNEVLFFASCIIPVYNVCLWVDAVVLNSIEFWTGNNPVAANTQTVDTENGKYIVEADENGYTITKGDQMVQFVQEDGVWYVKQGDKKDVMFIYTDDNHVCVNLGETSKVVELSQNGVNEFRAELAK